MGKKIGSLSGDPDYKAFKCPGCKGSHHIPTGAAPNAWGWNGSYEQPTFTPSILTWWGGVDENAVPNEKGIKWNERKYVCHSFVTDGKIQFLGDCTHALAGQTVDLPDIPESWE